MLAGSVLIFRPSWTRCVGFTLFLDAILASLLILIDSVAPNPVPLTFWLALLPVSPALLVIPRYLDTIRVDALRIRGPMRFGFFDRSDGVRLSLVSPIRSARRTWADRLLNQTCIRSRDGRVVVLNHSSFGPPEREQILAAVGLTFPAVPVSFGYRPEARAR